MKNLCVFMLVVFMSVVFAELFVKAADAEYEKSSQCFGLVGYERVVCEQSK